ncbi:MAG: PilT protein-like protein [Candidatus Roizmanbacteria bacterium GW2011_GWA2_37_7]|uniref:PilT protein-like protein n=1 Tax=Candidatus Roizmanbacteria bacterium GW2011_GWA2_37_7 TaxID=1618481 RepID=A0A0G0K9K7_9BACT|nr:MAG: PilT protein-like protein [Candidatus Roizmanbacteria bacterium GW2011_GWA2_37_7]
MEIKQFEKLLIKEKVCGCDAMLFIYLFEKNPRYYPWVSKLFYLGESGKIKIITSRITPIEILSAPKLITQPEKIYLYQEYFENASYLSVEDVSWDIVDMSAQLRREMKLRTPDAIQLATAQLSGANIFLTNDHHFNIIKSQQIYILDDMMDS